MTAAKPAFPWLPLAIVVAAAILAGRFGGTQPSPSPQPAPPAFSGPDMGPAFATNTNRAEAIEHARTLADILDELAGVIEYDGTLPRPRVKTAVQVDDLRIALRDYRMRGWSFLEQYPALRDALDKYFSAVVGTSGQPIDQPGLTAGKTRRQEWIDACRTLAESCRRVKS